MKTSFGNANSRSGWGNEFAKYSSHEKVFFALPFSFLKITQKLSIQPSNFLLYPTLRLLNLQIRSTMFPTHLPSNEIDKRKREGRRQRVNRSAAAYFQLPILYLPQRISLVFALKPPLLQWKKPLHPLLVKKSPSFSHTYVEQRRAEHDTANYVA